MTQVSTNVGILLTQTLGYFLSHGAAWRYILGAGVIIAAAQAFGLLLVPGEPQLACCQRPTHKGPPAPAAHPRRRPRHLGRDSRLGRRRYHFRAGRPAFPCLSDTSRRGSSSSGSKDAPVHLSFFQVARDPLYSRAIAAVVIVMIAQQLGGINAVMMYSTSLLQNAISVKSSLLTILVSVVNLFCTLAFSVLPDKLGRKACILVSGTGQGVAALLLAICIGMGSKTVAALLVVVFVAFFAVGLGPVPFILASEMVGQEAVGATQSWALGANYFATFPRRSVLPHCQQCAQRLLGWLRLRLLSVCHLRWRVHDPRCAVRARDQGQARCGRCLGAGSAGWTKSRGEVKATGMAFWNYKHNG